MKQVPTNLQQQFARAGEVFLRENRCLPRELFAPSSFQDWNGNTSKQVVNLLLAVNPACKNLKKQKFFLPPTSKIGVNCDCIELQRRLPQGIHTLGQSGCAFLLEFCERSH